jgi:CheY-like chemotaxis protein
MGEQVLSESDISRAESPTKIISWVTYGVRPAWVRKKLEPACLHHADYLVRLDDDVTLEDLKNGESDWDILFLGNGDKSDSDGSFGKLVELLGRNHALESVVAVLPESTAEFRATLHRCGAVDVLHLTDSGNKIREGLQHAIDIVRARHHQADQEKRRIVNQLAISVNHEINNPLTGLLGTAELMLMKKERLDDEMCKHLKTIVEQCHRIGEITSRLKSLIHLRTVPYGQHDEMLDLVGGLNQAPPVESVKAADQFLPPPNILVVDDNPLIADLIIQLFTDRFNVEAATCASDAIRMMEKGVYNLILVDLILPEMNGLELFRKIKTMNPGQKVLLMTAYQGDTRVEQAIHEGAAGCIFKPFSLEELEDVMSTLLKQAM